MIDNGYRVICYRCSMRPSGSKDALLARTNHGLCAKCMVQIMRGAETEEKKQHG